MGHQRRRLYRSVLPPRSRWAACAVLALALAGARDAHSQVQGAVAVGTSGEIQTALSQLGVSADLVPADRLRDVQEPFLPEELIRAFRLKPGEDSATRRPYIIFAPDTPLQVLADQLLSRGIVVEQLPVRTFVPQLPQPGCTDCLPVAPGVPGSIPPFVLPKLQPQFEAYSASQCAESATMLRGRIQAEPKCYLGTGIDPAYCSAPQAAVGYHGDYTRSCLLTAVHFSDPNLSQYAVLTPVGSNIPFCGALLVSPTLAITSAHCFHNQSTTRVRLRPWTARALEIPVSLHEASGNIASELLNEYPVVLRLSIPAPGAHSEVCFQDPGLTDPLQLFGYLASTTPLPDADWGDNLRSSPFACSAVSDSATNLVSTLLAGCYRHSCQAFGGFSGSPIFKDGPPPDCSTLVVGMHVGAAGPRTSCSGGVTNSALTGGLLRRVIESINEIQERNR